MKKLIVCDIDGTISDCRHRQHLAAQGAWDEFHLTMHEDAVIETTVEIIDELLCSDEIHLIFMTGRPDEYRETTEKWLLDICQYGLGEHYSALLMRPNNDFRRDFELKQSLFFDHISDLTTPTGQIVHEAFREEIGDFDEAVSELEFAEALKINEDWLKRKVLFLDDRDKVVAMWRDKGYTCWQVAEGAF